MVCDHQQNAKNVQKRRLSVSLDRSSEVTLDRNEKWKTFDSAQRIEYQSFDFVKLSYMVEFEKRGDMLIWTGVS